ncbi:MAG: hypothetical protein KJ069_22815 [Anaerolineae bacterium]|nr:hypothetical protein [Anaerolineae bacterium]
MVGHNEQHRWDYFFFPGLAGLLFGLLQTGLFFQLSFGLSSGFITFLMISLCWLAGSAVGLYLAGKCRISLAWFVGLGLLAYFGCVVFLQLVPFQTQFRPLYALLVIIMGVAPGFFFARTAVHYSARDLFFRENNGFIIGLVGGTLLFLLTGRVALWLAPLLVSAVVVMQTRRLGA